MGDLASSAPARRSSRASTRHGQRNRRRRTTAISTSWFSTCGSSEHNTFLDLIAVRLDDFGASAENITDISCEAEKAIRVQTRPDGRGAGSRDKEELQAGLTEISTFRRLCYTQNRRLLKKAKKILVYTQSTASVQTIDELVMTFDQLTFVRKECLPMFNDIHCTSFANWSDVFSLIDRDAPSSGRSRGSSTRTSPG